MAVSYMYVTCKDEKLYAPEFLSRRVVRWSLAYSVDAVFSGLGSPSSPLTFGSARNAHAPCSTTPPSCLTTTMTSLFLSRVWSLVKLGGVDKRIGKICNEFYSTSGCYLLTTPSAKKTLAHSHGYFLRDSALLYPFLASNYDETPAASQTVRADPDSSQCLSPLGYTPLERPGQNNTKSPPKRRSLCLNMSGKRGRRRAE